MKLWECSLYNNTETAQLFWKGRKKKFNIIPVDVQKRPAPQSNDGPPSLANPDQSTKPAHPVCNPKVYPREKNRCLFSSGVPEAKVPPGLVVLLATAFTVKI